MPSILGPVMEVMAEGDNSKPAYRAGHRLRLEQVDAHCALSINDLHDLIA